MRTLEIKKDLYWTGSLDPSLRIFDIIMLTEFGTTYNSYILKGSDKTALFETTKEKCFDEYLDKVKEITPIDEIDYIIVSHTEPDHSGSIARLLDLNPRIKLVGSGAAIGFIKEIVNRDFTSVIVKDGDELSLGNKTMRFYSVPNLHWPDTIYTYVLEDRVLITCDSFGAHYSLDAVTNDKIDNKENYMKALRYYYDMIMGPFKPYVLKALEKIKDLDIDVICPGHGPVLVENPREIMEIYREWSTEVNPNEKKTVVIPYVSAYGYTGILAKKIENGIKASGDIEVKLYDLITDDSAEALQQLYWADGILFGTPTIVGEALKPIWDMTTSIFSKTHGGKIASAFGSYGWSGEGVPNIIARLKQLNMKVYGQGLKVKFKPNDAQLQEAFEFGYNFGKSVLAGKIVESVKKTEGVTQWKCVVCGAIVEGTEPPAACPVCAVGPDQFVKIAVTEVTFQSDKNETFIVLGNGIAGITACEEIRLRNPVASIEMISKENVPGYNRPMLTKGILTEIDTLNFFIKPFSWYGENHIKLTLDTEVTAIDTTNKSLTLSNGEKRDYDKLIIAAGASSFVPPLPGTKLEGVFAIRTLETVNKLKNYLTSAEKVIVVGGGILGLEAAWELKKAGKDVTIIENGQLVMGRQLDAKGSELLRNAIEESGVQIRTGTSTEAVLGEKTVTGVKLGDGTEVSCDIVIFSTGVRANISFAKDAGLESDRAIKVSSKMETSTSDIYACGDCAEMDGINYAIWNEALEMAKVAGANAAGDEAEYTTVIPSNAYNGMGISLFSIGDTGKDPDKKYKTVEFFDAGKNTYEKMYFVNNRFCGGILMGDVSKTPLFIQAYENQKPMEALL